MLDASFLLLDDSRTVIRMVRNIIEKGIGSKKIFEASNNNEAIEILESNDIEIILADWTHGEKLLGFVKENARFKDVPFILMTSNSSREFLFNATQKGVSQHLVKPFTSRELEDKVRSSWNSAKRRKAERFASLPKHKLILEIGEHCLTGEVIDISRSGAFIRVEHVDHFTLFSRFSLSFEFDDVNTFEPFTVLGEVVRMEKDVSSKSPSRMCRTALYFPDSEMDPRALKDLDNLIEWMSAQKPELVHDS